MSLATSTILVTLNITQWTARKLDRNASNDLCDSKEAQRGSGNFNKLLIPKAHLKPIQRVVNSIRNYHYANTLPWEHKGADILPSRMYMDYMRDMGNLKTKFELSVSEFVTDYPTIIQQVEKSLGKLFNAEDYPTANQVRSKFSMKIDANPVPTVTDFRVDLNQEEIDKIKQDLGARLDAANNAAVNELFARLYTATAKAVITLKDPTKIFRNTLILNIIELARKIPKLNYTNNTYIDSLADQLNTLSSNVEIEGLRDDDRLNYRESIASDYEGILNNIEAAYNRSNQ
jgi:hypothetical protein